ITNNRNSTLDKNATTAFYTHAGKENAIASTKSFTSTAALLLLLGSRIVGKDFSDELYEAANIMESQLANADEYMEKIGGFIDPDRPLVLLGRGPSVLTAEQGSLTLKETSRIFAEAMSAPQFRHGPFELIEENLQAIFFNPKGKTYESNKKYVLEMAELGAKVIYVSDEPIEHKN
ncbi:SIS domain-containing protein, partial [Salmonella enterica subsp. enterica serovar Typhi]|nr:SIS domain-containing protein [Salmonella enterica subsp. enterica serovar Typhi]